MQVHHLTFGIQGPCQFKKRDFIFGCPQGKRLDCPCVVFEIQTDRFSICERYALRCSNLVAESGGPDENIHIIGIDLLFLGFGAYVLGRCNEICNRSAYRRIPISGPRNRLKCWV